VQGTIERAIENATGEHSAVTGSGRTDAGAHALAQVFAFSTSSALPATTLRNALNAHLPADIRVLSAEEVNESFHPRFDATSRVYRYLIYNREPASPFWKDRAALVRGPLDVDRMNEAAALLVGTYDFDAFVASTAEGPRTRTMFGARVWRQDALVTIELEANGFMQQMARSIAGTLILVGSGKLAPADISSILESRDRSRAGSTAPAHGLYLVDVRYPAAASAAATEVTIEETR
jgi:tRNA pseudouridine38-40 synthase